MEPFSCWLRRPLLELLSYRLLCRLSVCCARPSNDCVHRGPDRGSLLYAASAGRLGSVVLYSIRRVPTQTKSRVSWSLGNVRASPNNLLAIADFKATAELLKERRKAEGLRPIFDITGRLKKIMGCCFCSLWPLRRHTYGDSKRPASSRKRPRKHSSKLQAAKWSRSG